MVCNRCQCENPDGSKFCKACGHLLDAKDAAAGETASSAGVQPGQAAGNGPTVYTPVARHRPSTPPMTWRDVAGIVGFVSSVVGLFWFGIVLWPFGLVMSLLGFRGRYTRGMAVAGIVIASVGILVKIGWILWYFDLLPKWLTSGLFG